MIEILRDYWTGLRIVWRLRRSSRRYLRQYLKYGPSAGLTADRVRTIYEPAMSRMVRAALNDDNRP